jgi:hypothetical protein|nr:MAG TPA: hypothetical protein [Caudoviricetes sp.]
MSNQSPCTDPPCPCTALTLAEKNYALEQLTWLRKHMLAVNFRELEAVDAAICALRKAATADDCRVRKIPVYGMGQAKDAAYSQRGDDYLLEAQRIVDDHPPDASDMPENPPETVEDAPNPPKVPPKKRNGGWRC